MQSDLATKKCIADALFLSGSWASYKITLRQQSLIDYIFLNFWRGRPFVRGPSLSRSCNFPSRIPTSRPCIFHLVTFLDFVPSLSRSCTVSAPPLTHCPTPVLTNSQHTYAHETQSRNLYKRTCTRNVHVWSGFLLMSLSPSSSSSSSARNQTSCETIT